MNCLLLGVAVLIGFISLVPRSAESACAGMTSAECAKFRHGTSPFGRSLDPSTELRNLDLNKMDDTTLKRALDMLLAEKAMNEFKAVEMDKTETKKRLDEEEQQRSQYERIRELLDKLLQE